jgi:hypothetical protein
MSGLMICRGLVAHRSTYTIQLKGRLMYVYTRAQLDMPKS